MQNSSRHLTSLPHLTPSRCCAGGQVQFQFSRAESKRQYECRHQWEGHQTLTSLLFSFCYHLRSCVLTSPHQFLWGWDAAHGADAKFINGGGGRDFYRKSTEADPVKNEQPFRIAVPESFGFVCFLCSGFQ